MRGRLFAGHSLKDAAGDQLPTSRAEKFPGRLAARHLRLSAEFRFLASCLAWPRDGERSALLSRLAADPALDWANVLILAERHRVVGLVQAAIAAAQVQPPGPIAASLRVRSREVAFKELAMAAELAELNRALTGVGVHATVLKGLAAAVQAYDRIGLRQNRDIDLLVRPADLNASIEVLAQLGYVQTEPSGALSGAELKRWMRTHKDIVFSHLKRGVIVELHWRLFDNPALNTQLVEVGRVHLPILNGQEVCALSSDLAFNYTASHGAQHAWSRLKWLADFAAYVGRLGPKEVSRLYDEAKQTETDRPIAQGLLLMEAFFEISPLAQVSIDAAQDLKLRWSRDLAFKAIALTEKVEFEDHPFGSTIKTFSRYLLEKRLSRLWTQVILDLAEVPKSHTSPWRRRFGPLAKISVWIYRRTISSTILRSARSQSSVEKNVP